MVYGFLSRRIWGGLTGVLFLFFTTHQQPSQAVIAEPTTGFSNTDFLVSNVNSPGKIAVYDQNFIFKGYLENNFPLVLGLDILPGGDVVASGNGSSVRRYNSAGISTIIRNAVIGNAGEIKAFRNNRLYFARRSTASGVEELNLVGDSLRSFGAKKYWSVVVLPNGTLWANDPENPENAADVYNLQSGAFIGSFPLDNGQDVAYSMFYSAQTNTVLMSNGIAVYERTLSGAFVRKFTPGDGDLGSCFGVTRGPNGMVYATSSTDTTIHAWTAQGVYLGASSLTLTSTRPANIIWMGNASTRNSSVNAVGTLRNEGSAVQTSLWAANNRNGLGGGLFYADKRNKITVKSVRVNLIRVEGNTARIYGECSINGEGGYAFVATATDFLPSVIGRGDSLQIELSNGYSSGGTFNPGDVKVTGAAPVVIQ
jgi:hypothetical protein